MGPFWLWASALVILLRIQPSSQATSNVQYVQGTNAQGFAISLSDDRRPALYTNAFGDCLGSSEINVTRFDAAYYKDNMTVLFHLQGSTAVHNESLMMHIGVYAYGEARFDLTFNPCYANIESLCPMKQGVPIEANGIIPVAPSDVAGIPPIALSIPDFEGQAILRIYANSTQQEIGCYAAVVTNGVSLSQPKAIGSVLGILTIVAILASFATVVYGDHLPTMRTHYAHSVSVLVIFSVFQHIFFSGSLNLNWPSVLPAFWSNFAWASGMIYSKDMQNSINQFAKDNKGNTSMVGSASSGGDSLDGGISAHEVYSRSVSLLRRRAAIPDPASSIGSRAIEAALSERSLSNTTSGYSWYGNPVKPGLPLPGNFSGFGGTLAPATIPASNAFMTGFLWFLIALGIVIGLVIAFKWLLEGLNRTNRLKTNRLDMFRQHWLAITGLAVLRTCVIAFFMMMLLSIYQFSLKSSAGPKIIAAFAFIIFFVGILGSAGLACHYRLRFGRYESGPDRLIFEKKKILKCLPWISISRESAQNKKSNGIGSVKWLQVKYIDNDPNRTSVHQDEDSIKKIGWLAARFRRTRWWFFAGWLGYELIRACFYGGGGMTPLGQVFGLLFVEIVAMIAIVKLRPFEGARLNALVVYALSFSKITTVGLSAAFDARFNIGRITTTAIGIVIVVIQGILTLCLMAAIIVGAISSYMSITRYHEEFKPQKYASVREKYFAHIEKAATDLPPPPPPEPQAPIKPYFSVSAVRRCPKIEDEDEEFLSEISGSLNPSMSTFQPTSNRVSRSNSVGGHSIMSNGTSVPWGARVHRGSWTSKEHSGGQLLERPISNGLRYSGTSMKPLTRDSTGLSGSSSTSGRGSSPMAAQRDYNDQQIGGAS